MVYSLDKISVIMPVFNAEAHILGSVSSVLGQSFQNIELIVVDDGSTDSGIKVLENIKDQRLKVIAQNNSGVSAARNRGMAEAAGGYIAFIDADDSWSPLCMEELYNALKSNPDAALSYCGWQNVGLSGGRGAPYIPPDYECEGKIEYLLRTCPWPIHAALVRRNIIEYAGGFDESLSHAEDFKVWLEIAMFHRIVRVPKVLAFYNFHEGAQANKEYAKAALSHWSVQREFLKKHPDITRQLDDEIIKRLTLGELLKRGYICYWERNLKPARRIFRTVMKNGYGAIGDWKYMLPSLLPLSLHYALIRLFEKGSEASEV